MHPFPYQGLPWRPVAAGEDRAASSAGSSSSPGSSAAVWPQVGTDTPIITYHHRHRLQQGGGG